MLIINFEGREVKGLSKGRYDETLAGEDAVINKSVYLGFFIIYSSILIKLVSPIYSEMNRDLFYAVVVSDKQVK